MILRVEGKADTWAKELMNYPADKQDYEGFQDLIESFPVPRYFSQLRELVGIVRSAGLAACENECRVIEDFFKTDAYREISEFIDDYQFLDEGKVKSRKTEDIFEFNDWRDWANLCFDYRKELGSLYAAIHGLNFYTTVARAIDEEKWTKVSEVAEGTTVKLSNARNTRLEIDLSYARRYRSYDEEQPDVNVTPVDISLDPKRPISILSGTNGGGKTQYLQAVGSTHPNSPIAFRDK